MNKEPSSFIEHFNFENFEKVVKFSVGDNLYFNDTYNCLVPKFGVICTEIKFKKSFIFKKTKVFLPIICKKEFTENIVLQKPFLGKLIL